MDLTSERWFAEGASVVFPDGNRVRHLGCAPGNVPRARLIARAPEMAKMLLLLAGQDGDPYCQGCGHLERAGQHTKDCDLWRVLVEAGVVEGASVLSLVGS